MSRASKRKKLQRAKQTQMTSGVSSYNNSSMQTMLAQIQAKMKQPGDVLYGPGFPLQPQIGVNPAGEPRQWSFPLVYNTGGVDRTMGQPDIATFRQLRMLAKMYSGITLPERVWLDMVHGLKLTIGLKPEYKAAGMNDSDPEIQKKISEILTFFEKPDKVHDQHSWLKMMIRDQTQIDEMYLYKRRTRGGQLYALEVVAGDSVKPLLDDWGRVPEPPLGAYQQFPWGIPGEIYTTEDLIHYQETPQTDSPYGFGRVERFMMEVNQALRKKKRDLAMFTEGNIPNGIMEVPSDSTWTPDQIESYEQLWNALIAGNVQQQVRIKFTQPGMKYVPTDKGDILTDFDYFLYKVSCGVYGISLADIGFVEDIHKSSDQGQQNMMYRRTLFPIVSVYAHNIITGIIRDEFHEDRLEASFTGYEEETDFNTEAAGFQILANIGAIAPSDIAHKMGLPDVPKTGPFLMTKDGPVFLKDYEEGGQLRTLQQQSQVAGLQFAAQNPGGVQPPQEGEDVNDDGTQQSKEGKTGTGTAKDGESDGSDKVANAKDKKGEGSTQQSKQVYRGDGKQERAVDSEPVHTGMMVAFMLDPATAEQLAIDGGEPVEDLHCTLAYLGDSMEEPPVGKLHPLRTSENLSAVLKAFAQSASPINGNVGGIGRFTPSESSDGISPVIALVNAPGLQDFRRRLVGIMQSAGYHVANNFDYSPHITLSYIDNDAPMPLDNVVNIPLQFDSLCLAIGDDRYYFPIGETNESTYRTTDGTNNSEEIRASERASGLCGDDTQPSDRRIQRDDSDSIRSELRRWRTCALHDIERGRSVRAFESDILPMEERDAIRTELERCATTEEVKSVFRSFVARSELNTNLERDTSPKEQAVKEGGHGDHQTKSRIDWRNAPLA